MVTTPNLFFCANVFKVVKLKLTQVPSMKLRVFDGHREMPRGARLWGGAHCSVTVTNCEYRAGREGKAHRWDPITHSSCGDRHIHIRNRLCPVPFSINQPSSTLAGVDVGIGGNGMALSTVRALETEPGCDQRHGGFITCDQDVQAVASTPNALSDSSLSRNQLHIQLSSVLFEPYSGSSRCFSPPHIQELASFSTASVTICPLERCRYCEHPRRRAGSQTMPAPLNAVLHKE